MSVSIPIECPHCHAQGNLADPGLLGQPICCPTCQQVFVAPLPPANPAMDAPQIPATIAVPDVNSGDLAAALPQATLPELPQPNPVVPVEMPAQPMEQPVPVAPTAPVDATVPVNIEPPGAAPATWKFGAAPEEALAASLSVVTVAIAPATAPPAEITAAPEPNPVPMMPVPLAPIQAAQYQEAPAQAAAGFVMPGQVPVQTPPATAMYFPSSAIPGAVQPVVHAMDGPLPGFMAPAPPPGHAELSFAQNLPEPAARGAIPPPKPQSKLVQNLAIGAVTAVLLLATILFLMGDPLRGVGKPKPGAKKDTGPTGVTPSDVTAEDAFSRINALNKPKSDK